MTDLVTEARPLTLPDYGLGTAGLGNLYRAIDDQTALDTLDAARANGFSYLDTAPFYGHGLSEQRVGTYLASQTERPIISTKVGRVLAPAGEQAIPDNGFASPAPFIPHFDYSASGIHASFEQSCERLGVERVDILLLHDIGRKTHGDRHPEILTQALNEALPAMRELQAQGRTRWIGLGVNETDICEEVLTHTYLDVLLIAGRYTLLEHEGTLAFLDYCYQQDVKVIVGGAFNSGLLVAPPEEAPHYDYAPAPTWAIERASALREICARHETPLPAAALQFCRAHPAVASVIPGAQSPSQVRELAKWAKLSIPGDLWERLKDEDLISRSAPVPS